jgi:hypothetical protein
MENGNGSKFRVLVLAFSILTAVGLKSALAGAAGPGDGGGGSQEADMFTATARQMAQELGGDPQTRKYGELLLVTLNAHPLEVVVVDTLDGKCDGGGANTTDDAYSCIGHIYLLKNPWGNKPPGQGWLVSNANAIRHIKEIFHEVFRAATPVQGQFYTNDAGYSATGGADLIEKLAEMAARAPLEEENLENHTEEHALCSVVVDGGFFYDNVVLHMIQGGVETKVILDGEPLTQVHQITKYIVDGTCVFNTAQMDVLRNLYAGVRDYDGEYALDAMNRAISKARVRRGH